MALYDYKCVKCGHIHEETHSMASTPDIRCVQADCDGHCLKAITSAPVVCYKGANWDKSLWRKIDMKNGRKRSSSTYAKQEADE